MKDHYSTLGVAKNATQDEIKSAYRKLAKQHHPDLGGDADKFKAINEAYDVLGDPNKRSEYDRPQARFEQHFQDPFAQNPFGDDFFSIFMNAAGMPGRQPRNNNIRINLEVTLESVLAEQTKTVRINTGNDSSDVAVTIPKGIRNGAVISYKGLGQKTLANRPPGDLLVEVRVKDHPRFARLEDDLQSNVTITAFDAILGKELDFTTIAGKTVRINIPPGTQSGTKLRLKGHGMPKMNVASYGDQFLVINVLIPNNLTTEQLDHVRAAAGKTVEHDIKFRALNSIWQSLNKNDGLGRMIRLTV